MEDKRTIPFADTPLEAGRISVCIDEEGDASVWVLEEEVVGDAGDVGWLCRCPFERHRTGTFVIGPCTPDVWVGPDLPSVLSYLRLIGVNAI